VTVACLPIFFIAIGSRVGRVLFLAYAVAYVSYLILDATQHDALPLFSTAMLYFVLR